MSHHPVSRNAELRSARERNSDCRRIGNLNESAGASGSARPCVRPGSGAGSPTSDDESTTSTLTPLSSPEPETPGTSPYREVGSYGLRIQSVQSPTISRCFPDPKPEPYESSSGRQAGEPRPSEVSLGKRPERWQETSSSTWPAPRRRSTFPALNWRREYSVQQFTVDPRRERAIRSRNEKVVWRTARGTTLSSVPLPATTADLADLYVNLFEEQGALRWRVWLRVEPPAWELIGENHPHPFIQGYVLRMLDNGQPRWVTKHTYRTYVWHWKKLGIWPVLSKAILRVSKNASVRTSQATESPRLQDTSTRK